MNQFELNSSFTQRVIKGHEIEVYGWDLNLLTIEQGKSNNPQKNSGLCHHVLSACKFSAVHKDNEFSYRQLFKLYHGRRTHSENL